LNAQDYAELIDRCLCTFRYLENRSHRQYQIEIPKNNPSSLRLKTEIPLQNDLCLSVKESVIFEKDKMVERSFSYDFRDRGTGKMIWRIDNHSRWQSVASRCHVHTNPDDEEELNEYFHNSQQTDFPYVMRCLRKHYEQEPQDWEVNPDDTTK